MGLKSLLKYILRFVFLQTVIFMLTIWYFDKFVYLNEVQKNNLYNNLLDDRLRFYRFIPIRLISIDLLIFFLIFIFLIILYSTKFYTYVNELDFSYDTKRADDYFILYLLWNSYLFASLYVFRFEGLSRLSLFIFSFLVPLILLIFRNSEFISILLGRSISKENYISVNLEDSSNFKNLRIIAFRNEKLILNCSEEKLSKVLMDEIEKLNKTVNINLIVIRVKNIESLDSKLERYLIELNKKVLIISDKDLTFHQKFIFRKVKIDNKNIYYFNNDIQYGSKFILKRTFDVFITSFLLIFLLPIIIFISLLIFYSDSNPTIIKQSRVGLHGKVFNMYKFRTMYKDTHNMRQELKNLNTRSGPLFKIENDPRIIKNLMFLRKYSLDELPQLINVIKGEMSLVGPRPLFEEDTKHFDKNYMRRLNVLPGLTGLLQIHERNTSDFEIWYKYDIEYIENWSLYLDLKILLKTLPALKNKKVSGL